MATEAAIVRRQTTVAAPREDVWQALTDPDRLREWFANDVELDAEPGGRGVFRWDDGSTRVATVEDADAERRFAFRWSDPESGTVTAVELTLEDVDEGTRVTVVETPAAADVRASASVPAAEWSWGIALLAALPRLHQRAHARA